MKRIEIYLRAFAGLIRIEQRRTSAATELHDMTERGEPQQCTAIFLRKGTANARLLLHELAPEIFVFGQQFERRRQAEIVSVFVQEFETEGVDRSEPGTIE